MAVVVEMLVRKKEGKERKSKTIGVIHCLKGRREAGNVVSLTIFLRVKETKIRKKKNE